MYNSILKDALGNAFPKGCNGYYTALTWSKAWSYNDGSNQIYLTPHSSHPEAPQKNLLGQFVTMPLNNLCLKFEVYIPEKLPWWSHAYFVFTAYGTEDENDPSFTDNAYGEDAKHGFLARDLTSNGDEGIDWEYLEDGNQFICKFPENKYGVPAAWFHMGVYNVVEDGGSATGVSGYSTKHGWMTVCVPLNDNYFRYPVSDRGIATSDVYKACGTLRNDIDFFNFYMNIDDDKDFQKKAKTGFDNYMFLAVDNFRIVPEDNGGARFSKYSGVTPGSAYPY